MLSKTKRPFLALALSLGILGLASAASAADGCTACAQPTYCTPACYTPVTVTPPPPPVVCDTCASSGVARTNLPGWYSNDYDYSLTSQVDTGITYWVPTVNGVIETHRIPLTNPVDRYYATHEIWRGQVVDTGDLAMR